MNQSSTQSARRRPDREDDRPGPLYQLAGEAASSVALRPSVLAATGYGSMRERSPRKLPGLVVSLLAHLLVLWLILNHKTVLDQASKLGGEKVITYLSAPNPGDKPKPTKQAEAPKAPPKKAVKTIVDKNAPPPIRPDLVAQEPAPVPAKPEPVQTPAPAEDMSAMLDAARKRRAEARERNRDPNDAAEETEAQRANRIARANIAQAIGTNGRDQNDAGGVFQVRRRGVSSGEFFFRGWSTAFGRKSSQLVSVYAENGDDIEVAMVKRMIEIIRAEKPDEFIWESRRLGRSLTLSTKPSHRAELTRFLLEEFFPDYLPSRR